MFPSRPISPPDSVALAQALGYQGPERRGGSAALTRLLALVLDEIDYGLMLVADDQQVLHANHAARSELRDQHPLQLLGRGLRARLPQDVAPLHEALQQARQRGLRRLLSLGEAGARVGLSVVPLGGLGGTDPVTLLVLGKREVCGSLSVHGFAREHRLSPSEEQVLRGLCEGDSPLEIAERHGVKIATVRTQIANIRAKTGAESIRDLVQRVAVLPPMVGALRRDTWPALEAVTAAFTPQYSAA